MAAYTSSQSGNWSSSSTWGGAGVPASGDTATIGAHIVTVTSSTSVGTSPNDNTTKVVDLISASSSLIINTGVTLTIKGNLGGAHNASVTLNAGSGLLFDASASGGTPVYTWVNVGFCRLSINGTSNSRCTLGAVSGQTYSIGQNYTLLNVTYTDFTRVLGSFSVSSVDGVVSNCTFNGCGKIFMSASSGSTQNYVFNNNIFTGSTATEAFQNSVDASYTSGLREMIGNVFDKAVTYNAKNFNIRGNYFGSGMTCISTKDWTNYRLNFSVHNGGINSGNGARYTGSVDRSYFVVDNTIGNPHFLAPEAKNGVDTEYRQNIFEAHAPDLIDSGDVLLVQAGAISAGRKVVGRNNISIPNSYPSAGVMSGSLLTLYNADINAVTEFYNNTNNLDSSSISLNLGMLDTAEAGTGFAGQVAAFKSNIGWSSNPNEGHLVIRLSGNVKDIVTPANADYNWRENLLTGNNGRGYNDSAANNTMFTAGDTSAAGVDIHQGSGACNFLAPTRNIQAWATARNYGDGSFNAGLTALQTSTESRVADLINYIFEGFKPTNSAMRNAAHNGGCVGAANFHKSTRTFTKSNIFSKAVSKFGV